MRTADPGIPAATDMSASVVNIAAHLPAMARRQPDAAAVIAPHGAPGSPRRTHRSTTFQQLEARSNAIAAGLSRHGVARGMRTVLMAKPSADFFALTFGLFKIGAVPVLVDPGMGIRNLGECLAQAEPEAFIGITKAHVARHLFGWAKRTLRLFVNVGPKLPGCGESLDRLAASCGEFEPAATRADETASILFTSGSTGVPKGAVYTHGVFAAQVEMLRAMYGIEPGEIDLPTFPLFALFAPALGMTSVVPQMDFSRPGSVDPREILQCLRDFGCTTMFGSPAVIDKVGRYGALRGEKLPKLKRVLSAGAPVPAATLERFAAMLAPGVEVFTPYGATESLPVASIGSAEVLGETRARTERGEGVWVGKPAPGVDARIMKIRDDAIAAWSEDLLAGPGELGEIVVGSPTVTREYFGRPEQTALAKIRDAATGEILHRMGDLGWIDEKGRIWYCGRKSQRVTTAEGVLFTDRIENVFNVHPETARTALVGVRRGERAVPVLCVELDAAARGADRERVKRELLELGAKNAEAGGIREVLFHPKFPVDVRHNAKIFREKLAVWAAEKLR
ncbi:MAG TPA: fatty acid CoA ligase family protein [Planctomycetia bacterium]|nr:fatty acid CoA ligase family protein [Planctomycetia bacterium]